MEPLPRRSARLLQDRVGPHQDPWGDRSRRDLQFLLVLLLLTLCVWPGQAQEPLPRLWTSFAYPASFEHISVEQGLSQSTVHCILQDRKGFLWFGTDTGLNRYDGFRFQIFHPEKDNPNSLSGDWVLSLLEDHRGYIWVGTRNGGVTILDPETMVMVPLQAPHQSGGGPAQTANALAEDREGNVWIGTDVQGLVMVPGDWKMPKPPPIQTFQASKGDPTGAPTGSVHAIYCDQKGTLWIGSRRRGLGRMVSNPGGGRLIFDYFPHDPAHPDTSAPPLTNNIAEDNFGLLWLGGDNGPSTFDPARSTFQRWKAVEGESINVGNSRVLSLLRDSAGTMWVASDGGGLLKALPRSNALDPVRFQRFACDPKDPRSLSGNGLQWVFEDRSGVLWASSYQGGLNKLVLYPGRSRDRERPPIFHYRNNAADPLSLSGNTVSSMGEDQFGNLWVGTDGFGLNRVHPPTQPGGRIRFERFRDDPRRGPGSLQTDVILTTHVDPQKRLWFGSYNGGLIRMDLASATAQPRFTHFRSNPADPNSLSSNFIRSIVDDGAGGFWVATDGSGMNHFDPRTGRAKRYEWGEGPKVSSSDRLYLMVKDAFDTLWIATPMGLNRFNPATEEFRVYKPGPAHSISEVFVNTLYIDASGTLWVGTGGGGLNRMTIPPWNGPEPQFTAYGMREGLPGNIIKSILPDGKGNLWIATGNALGRFNIQEGRGYPCPWQGELRKAEFIWNSRFVSSAGEMLFGSNDGLTLFHPQDITYNQIVPPIAIAGFQVFNKALSLGDRATQRTADGSIQEITIHPKDSVFSFDFAALHFVAPERNHYAYLMEGLDPTWNEIGSKHSVSYTGLAPGRYNLRVKGSNCDGVWGDVGLKLKVHVLPPWYKTWWFRTSLVGLLLGLVYAVIRIRIQVLHHRNQMLEEVVAKRTQELAEANEALRNQSLTDPLTGLRNRRFLYACMPEDIAQVQRVQRDVAANSLDRMKQNIDVLFLMVDLDHFKQVNDHHGHHAGDMVLQQMGEILRKAMRDSDTITRWGGEEFLIVARNAARTDATILPERIRAAVEAHAFEIGKEQPIHCHCSIGFSVFPFLPGDMGLFSWEQVVDIADACLYAAKRSGRNGWVGIVPELSQIEEPQKAACTGGVEDLIQSGLFHPVTSLNIPIQWETSTE